MTTDLRRWSRYLLAVVAHHSGLDFLYRRITGAGLVVLMLHRLRDDHDPYPLSTSRSTFTRLVEWLRERQALVGLEEGLRHLEDPKRSDTHYAITFDDGYRDNLSLLDADLGALPAVVYVVTGAIGSDPIWVYRLHHMVESRSQDRLDLGHLGLGQFDLSQAIDHDRLYAVLPARLKQLMPDDIEACIEHIRRQLQPVAAQSSAHEMLEWDEVRDLRAGGVEIGAHTRSHVLLSRVDDATAAAEIRQSREDIAAHVGQAPAHFAYPNGRADDFGDRDVALARAAGFRTAVTSIEGINRRGGDPYRILRHNVHETRYRTPRGALSPALFFSETSGLLGWLRTRRTA